MQIIKLQLQHYRNYAELQMQFGDTINILCGQNAQGKTNIIESIYYAALGISHRNRLDGQLVQFGEKTARITVDFLHNTMTGTLELNIFTQKRKEIKCNGESIRQKDLVGLLNIILFAPEDLMLIKGSPQNRRRFLDICLSQISPVYYEQLVQYNHVLKQRNNLLKMIKQNPQLQDSLEMWDWQLANLAASIVATRLEAVNKLNSWITPTHQYISGNIENLVIRYLITGAASTKLESKEDLIKWYQEQLQHNVHKDIARGSTSIGPHRDDWEGILNNIPLKDYGSQGQQRSSVLSLKLAELRFLYESTGQYPILLLDDVMSELDNYRQANLLAYLQEKQIQTIITTTDSSFTKFLTAYKLFTVQQGVVTEVEDDATQT